MVFHCQLKGEQLEIVEQMKGRPTLTMRPSRSNCLGIDGCSHSYRSDRPGRIKFRVHADFFENLIDEARFRPFAYFDFWNFLQGSRLVIEVSAFLIRIEIHQAVYRPSGFEAGPKVRCVLAIDIGAALAHGIHPRVLIFGKVAACFHDRRGEATQMFRLVFHHFGGDGIHFLDDRGRIVVGVVIDQNSDTGFLLNGYPGGQ